MMRVNSLLLHREGIQPQTSAWNTPGFFPQTWGGNGFRLGLRFSSTTEMGHRLGSRPSVGEPDSGALRICRQSNARPAGFFDAVLMRLPFIRPVARKFLEIAFKYPFIGYSSAIIFPKYRREYAFMPQAHLDALHPEKVSFSTSDGIQLKGYWLRALSDAKGKRKSIIMAHGFWGNSRMWIQAAKAYQERGYNVFLFDFRGHGTSGGWDSSIGFHEGKDIAAAVRYVATHHAHESEELDIWAHSMAAIALMMTARSLKGKHQADLDVLVEKIHGIVLDSPPADMSVIYERYIKRLGGGLQENVHGTKSRHLNGFFSMINQDLQSRVHSCFHFDPSTTLRDLKPGKIFSEGPLANKPTLLLHGEDDKVIPIDHVDVNSRYSRKNPNLVVKILENTDHTGMWAPENPEGHVVRYRLYRRRPLPKLALKKIHARSSPWVQVSRREVDKIAPVRHLAETKPMFDYEIPLPPVNGPNEKWKAEFVSQAYNIVARHPEQIRLIDDFLSADFSKSAPPLA